MQVQLQKVEVLSFQSGEGLRLFSQQNLTLRPGILLVHQLSIKLSCPVSVKASGQLRGGEILMIPRPQAHGDLRAQCQVTTITTSKHDGGEIFCHL